MRFASAWEFERHVQDLLDAGAEPIDDVAVIEYLDRHPEQLDGFASLLAGVATLQSRAALEATPRATRRRSWFVAAAAAGLLVISWFLWPDAPTRHDAGSRPLVASIPHGPPPAVVRTEVAVSRWTPSEVTESRSIDDSAPIVRTRVLAPHRFTIPASGSAPRGVIAESTVHTID